METIPKFAERAVAEFRRAWHAGYAAAEKQCDGLVEVQHATASSFDMLAPMSAWLGDRPGAKTVDVPISSFHISHRVPLQDIVDGHIDHHAGAVREIGFKLGLRVDIAVAQVLAENPTVWDGEPLFARGVPETSRGFENDQAYSNKVTGFDRFYEIAGEMRARRGEDGKPLGVEPRTVIVPAKAYARAVAQLPRDVEILALRQMLREDFWYVLGDGGGKVKPFYVAMRTQPECNVDNVRWEVIVHSEPRMGITPTLPHLFTRCRVKEAE